MMRQAVLGRTALVACIASLASATPAASAEDGSSFDYSSVLSDARDQGVSFGDLPGFTRSVYSDRWALITPESRVWAPLPGWSNALTAHLMSPASAPGTLFTMYLARLGAGGATAPPPKGIERFVFVLDGAANLTSGARGGPPVVAQLHAGGYAYLPPGHAGGLSSDHGAGMLVYERRYAAEGGSPELQHGNTDEQATLETAGEVFVLRKLLPATDDYDFNVHVMDFAPGQYLNVKEVHYNQHGLLMLQGQGIYRLGDSWMPVQAGDAIFMGPFVPQWFGALGTQTSRYILVKDTTVNPALA